MRLGRSCGAFALFLVFSAPALAFDDLLRSVGALPTGVDAPHVFDYVAPLDGFSQADPAHPSASSMHLANALRAGGVDGTTGIDFGKATGVLTIGDPPQTLTFVFGEAGFADEAPATLLTRDFEESAIEGVNVFAKGDDYAIDMASARLPDPFGNGLGQSQRIALGDQYVLRAAGWPELRSTLAALPGLSPDRQIWTAMIEGLRAAAGDGAHLSVASGWTASAFLGGLDVGALLDPEAAKDKLKLETPGVSSFVFPFAIFAVTESSDQASVHITLPFGNKTEAEGAAAQIAERLAAYPLTASALRISVEEVGAFAVAVLSMDYPATESAEARKIFSTWMNDVYSRNFQPLMLTF